MKKSKRTIAVYFALSIFLLFGISVFVLNIIRYMDKDGYLNTIFYTETFLDLASVFLVNSGGFLLTFVISNLLVKYGGKWLQTVRWVLLFFFFIPYDVYYYLFTSGIEFYSEYELNIYFDVFSSLIYFIKYCGVFTFILSEFQTSRKKINLLLVGMFFVSILFMNYNNLVYKISEPIYALQPDKLFPSVYYYLNNTYFGNVIRSIIQIFFSIIGFFIISNIWRDRKPQEYDIGDKNYFKRYCITFFIAWLVVLFLIYLKLYLSYIIYYKLEISYINIEIPIFIFNLCLDFFVCILAIFFNYFLAYMISKYTSRKLAILLMFLIIAFSGGAQLILPDKDFVVFSLSNYQTTDFINYCINLWPIFFKFIMNPNLIILFMILQNKEYTFKQSFNRNFKYIVMACCFYLAHIWQYYNFNDIPTYKLDSFINLNEVLAKSEMVQSVIYIGFSIIIYLFTVLCWKKMNKKKI